MLLHVTSNMTKKSFGKMTDEESEAYDAMVDRIKKARAKGLIIDIPNDGIELH